MTRILGPGDVAGLVASLGHDDIAEEVVALHRVDALLLSGASVRQLITDPGCARGVLRALAAEHAAFLRDQARFDASSTGVRVEVRLLELADRFGVSDRGSVHIGVRLTQEQLASWARSSRESTVKTLHELRRGGIIATARRHLTILDLPRLRARNEDEGSDRTVRALLRSIG